MAVLLLAVGPIAGPTVRLLAAALAGWYAYRGWARATGRERQVRTWIGLAVGVWLASEMTRFAGAFTNQPLLLADLSVIGLAIAATGTFVTAAHGRMRPADEAAFYLDSVAVFSAMSAAVLVLGGGLATDAIGLGILAHAAFFVAIVAATLLLAVTTRTALRFVGQWEMLVGLALGAAGYLSLLLPVTEGPMRTALHVTVAAGALLAGHGGGHWSAEEHPGSRYLAISRWLRRLLPMVSVAGTAVLAVTLITQPTVVDGGLRIAAVLALGLVVISVVARQTVLLADRELVISRERQLTDELTVADAQYRAVVERVPGVVYVAEAGTDGRWHFASARIEEMLGYSPEEWIADPGLWLSRVHPDDRDRMALAEIGDAERTQPHGRWEYRLIARDGRVVWVIDDEAIISRDADDRPAMVQGILVDISDRKDLEDQLRHQALHDPLTALPNRVLFVDRLSHALVRRRAPDASIAVLFVDLDDFKAINDTLGHAVGDELLRLVAVRLSGVLRAEDTAGRLGGDEFAFLLEDAGGDTAEVVAARILDALAAPFTLGEHSASLTASIGIATCGLSVDPDHCGESADKLLRDADTAMYAAKSLGKGRVQSFDHGMHERTNRLRELRSDLAHAIATDQLVVDYQPIVDMRHGQPWGLEALVRWEHPQLGRLTPADFIPLAEEGGLIKPLGEWVMRRACADLADASVIVSVNVSAHQLDDGALSALVQTVLADSGMAASRLLLELTESTLASAGAGAETELQRVQAMGVRIALDDFGSGYSSLEYLGRLPIDILKIDRSLVERVHDEPQRQEVMRAISHIAEKLGLETIVEGVEHEAQRTTLLELGFRRAQGFLFSRPVPLPEALSACLERKAS